jgi:alanyl-tRNA synthetase
VLRKILRRAIRHGKMLGTEQPFIYTLTGLVGELMKSGYPELEQSRDYAATVVRHEEEKFSTTLSQGMAILDDVADTVTKRGQRVLPGPEIFKLYDTYGFPLDLAKEIAAERDLEIDEAGFYSELEKQRERARASWKGTEKTVKPVYRELSTLGKGTEFTGYTELQDIPGTVLAVIKGDEKVQSVAEGETGEILLDRSPFYAEAGGQVGDKGTIETEGALAQVEDVLSPMSGLRLHRVKIKYGTLRVGDLVRSSVFVEERRSTAQHHTATHLLHAALREVLGTHVKQAGSLVAPDRLRFDFTHYRALTPAEISDIEQIVNQRIQDNIQVVTELSDLDHAISRGAMALFGEKYQQQVRVVQVPGFSMELCGGTHVSRTGDIGAFKIIAESSISAGVRRIEAVAGMEAIRRFLGEDALLSTLGEMLRSRPEDLPKALGKLMAEQRETQKQVEQLQLKLAQKESKGALQDVRDVRGVRVLSQKVENVDRNALRSLADELKNQLQSGVVVLGSPVDGKVSLVVMVTPDLVSRVKANELIRRIAPLVGGGGGGRPDMAEAGGKDPSALDAALASTFGFVEELLT